MLGRLTPVEVAHHEREKQRWFSSAVAGYCESTDAFASKLAELEPRPRGFLALRAYLASYRQSDEFASLRAQTGRGYTSSPALDTPFTSTATA